MTSIDPSSSSSSTWSSRQFQCWSCECSGAHKLFRLLFFIRADERPLSVCDEESVEWLRLRHHLHEFHNDDLKHFISTSKRQPQLEKNYFPSQTSDGTSQFLEFFCQCTPQTSDAFHSYLWCSTDLHGRPKEFLKPMQISAATLSLNYSKEEVQSLVVAQTQARALLKTHVQQFHANNFQNFFCECDWHCSNANDQQLANAQTPAVSAPHTPLAATSFSQSISLAPSSASSPASATTPSSSSSVQLPPSPRFDTSQLRSFSSSSSCSSFSSSSVFSSPSIASDVVELESALLGLSEDEVRRLKRNEAEAKRRKGESDAMMALAVLVEGDTAIHNRSDRLTIMRKSANALQTLQSKVDELQATILQTKSKSLHAVAATHAADSQIDTRKRKHPPQSAFLDCSPGMESALKELRQSVSDAHQQLSGMASEVPSLQTNVQTVLEANRIIRSLLQRLHTTPPTYSHAAAVASLQLASANTNSNVPPFNQDFQGTPTAALNSVSSSSQSLPRVSPVLLGNGGAIPAMPPGTPATSVLKSTPHSLSLSRPGGEYMFTWADTPLIIAALKNFSRSHNALIIFSRDSVRGEEQWATVARELNHKIAVIRDGLCAPLHSRRLFNRVDSLKRRHFQKASQDAINAAHTGLETFLKKNAARLLQTNVEHGTVLLNRAQLRSRLEQMIYFHQSGGMKSFAVGFQSAEDIREIFGSAAVQMCEEIHSLFESCIKEQLLMKDYDAYRWALELYHLSRIKLSSHANTPANEPQTTSASAAMHMHIVRRSEQSIREVQAYTEIRMNDDEEENRNVDGDNETEEESEMLEEQSAAFEETESESELSSGQVVNSLNGANDYAALKRARTDIRKTTTIPDQSSYR